MLLALAALAGQSGRNPTSPLRLDPESRPEAVEASFEGRSVTLGALRVSPGRHLGQSVRFVVQFRALVEDWNPYLSRFDSARWLALEAWPDEFLTWDQGAFDAPAGRMFLRRGGGFEPLVRRARTYQRFELRGRVREVFLGEPWIEIETLLPLEGEVGEGSILHVNRAREVASQGQFDLALQQYERARAAPLPPHALAALLAEIQALKEARERAKNRSPVRRVAPTFGESDP